MFDGTIKEAKLLINAKKLFKILSRIRFAHARGIRGYQYTEVVLHIVVTTVLSIASVVWEKRLVQLALTRSSFCFLYIVEGDVLALIRYPDRGTSYSTVEPYTLTRNPLRATGS